MFQTLSIANLIISLSESSQDIPLKCCRDVRSLDNMELFLQYFLLNFSGIHLGVIFSNIQFKISRITISRFAKGVAKKLHKQQSAIAFRLKFPVQIM